MTDPMWFTSSDGLQIAYEDEGSNTSRPPVVLHHGFAASGYLNWVAPGVVGALVSSGRRVVTLDARGHGRSDKPHDTAFYGETKMAADVSTLIDVLGVDEIDLVGYSMGAIVSLIVGSQEPRVRRMVIGGIGAGVVERGGVDTRALKPKELVAALVADDPSTITDRVAKSFRAFADSTGADRLALAAQVASAHRQAIPLDQITAPTLVLVGRDDELAVRPQVLAAAIPGAELLVIDGDHLGAVGKPAFAPAIVEFING
jgi:pimeloyl-ACP methyl ester carboxylesterase